MDPGFTIVENAKNEHFLTQKRNLYPINEYGWFNFEARSEKNNYSRVCDLWSIFFVVFSFWNILSIPLSIIPPGTHKLCSPIQGDVTDVTIQSKYR